MYNFFMQRVMLVIEYDGTNFVGWQKQRSGRSVQQEVEQAIEKVTGQAVKLVGSSRTDAKVHALGQVAHFDMDSTFPAERLKVALNDILTDEIKILSSKTVKPDFNARFDVKKKTYVYLLETCEIQSPFKRNYVATTSFSLDIKAMENCAKLLEGEHNFKGFCSAQAQVKTFVRTIYDIRITKNKDCIKFTFTGNGFLQHMVRILVGTLVDVGRGKLSLQDVKLALENGDRSKAGKTMPPQGLYLKKIYF